MILVFKNRIEITNPGEPLIEPKRFLDAQPRSRNEQLAGLARKLRICEERGTGIDRVVEAAEFFQLPPPDFSAANEATKVTLFAPRRFDEMTKDEKRRATYQHASLLYLTNREMTNTTLRERFGTDDAPAISRIIKDTVKAHLVRPVEEGSRRHARYVPYWANVGG